MDMLEELEKKNAYTDNRNRDCLITKDEAGYFLVVEQAIKIKYAQASDQYLVIDNVYEFWDPVTGFVFLKTSGICYKCVSSEDLFIYRDGYYQPVPYSKHENEELNNFLKTVWRIKRNKRPTKATLNLIYYSFYLKKSENQKKLLEHKDAMGIIQELVLFSKGKRSHLQKLLPFLNDSGVDGYYSIDQLFNILLNEKNDLVLLEMANISLSGYYYYYSINIHIEINVRIVLNVAPENVTKALKTLWKIISNFKVVHSMKVCGPSLAVKKLDSIIIYADSKQDQFKALLQAIEKAGILTEDLLPALLNKITKGIGVGNESDKVKGVRISFGQIRVILAFMALNRSSSEAEMLELGALYFSLAGIDIKKNDHEIKQGINPVIEEELAYLLNIMTTIAKKIK